MSARNKKPKPISLRAYAERRGVSPEAVSKAVAARRLRGSVVTVDGEPKIADPELADREWEANTRPRADRVVANTAPTTRPPAAELPTDVPDYMESRARREAAAARREAAQAELAELDVAERRGELVSAAEARADVIDMFATVKTRILGVPSRVAQRLPRLAAEVVPVLDTLLREALEELSDDSDSSEDPPGDGDDI